MANALELSGRPLRTEKGDDVKADAVAGPVYLHLNIQRPHADSVGGDRLIVAVDGATVTEELLPAGLAGTLRYRLDVATGEHEVDARLETAAGELLEACSIAITVG